MKENFGNNLKIDLTPIQKQRILEEQSAHISDHSFKKYQESVGIDFAEMKGKRVLDIGSGLTEKFSKEAAKINVKVFSLSPHLKDGIPIGYGVKKNKFSKNWQEKSIAARAQEIPFKDNVFDYEIALFSVPYYLPFNNENEYKIFFREVIRTLKPGGKGYVVPVCADDIQKIVSRDFISMILNQLSDLSTYVIEKLPKSKDKESQEYRLVLTKKA